MNYTHCIHVYVYYINNILSIFILLFFLIGILSITVKLSCKTEVMHDKGAVVEEIGADGEGDVYVFTVFILSLNSSTDLWDDLSGHIQSMTLSSSL